MAEGPRGHLVFACGGSLYAVPAERASEVVNLPVLTRVPGVVLVRVGKGAMAFTATKVIGVAPIEGTPPRLGESGALAFMHGPARVPAGECAAIEPEGLLEYLSRGR